MLSTAGCAYKAPKCLFYVHDDRSLSTSRSLSFSTETTKCVFKIIVYRIVSLPLSLALSLSLPSGLSVGIKTLFFLISLEQPNILIAIIIISYFALRLLLFRFLPRSPLLLPSLSQSRNYFFDFIGNTVA